MSISSQMEDWLFYLQTSRVIETPMKIQDKHLTNNLNRSQLLAGGTVDLSTSSGNVSLGAGDEEEVVDPSVDTLSKRNKASKVNAFL